MENDTINHSLLQHFCSIIAREGHLYKEKSWWKYKAVDPEGQEEYSREILYEN